MVGYQPIYIAGNQVGLVQEREEFLLPNDAYPVLENAYVWRERIKRKQGYTLLGRFRRNLTGQNLGSTDGSGNFSGNIISILGLETTSSIVLGTLVLTIGADTFTENVPPNGTLTGSTGGTATINYATGSLVISGGPAATPISAAFGYYPGLPVMGLRQRELASINNQQTVGFDTKYAYVFSGSSWQEFIPGTTWTGNNSEFFWSTNYWTDPASQSRKLFWVTNFSGTAGDPIRYTNGITWTNFAPQIDASGNLLTQCLVMLPFRGRLVVGNTYEGMSLAGSANFQQRIRWSAIGSPLTTNSWRQDIIGQGGFLDIPTSESIISFGFVRDNMIVYCENSTWQLRYTGRSVQPFQIERVNSELGSQSTFSAVQFDTSLIGIGNKGIIECDSYKSERIDVKIPDFTFQVSGNNNGTDRIHGIRDFQQRLAYWTFPYAPSQTSSSAIYPNRRLVYNYENDSWAMFIDSFTALGYYQPQASDTWASTPYTWAESDFPWINEPSNFPAIIGGNQVGFVEYLSSNLSPSTSNDPSIYISNIIGNNTTPTQVTCPNHNLVTDTVIQITGIPTGTPFANLNGVNFQIFVVDSNNIQLWKFNSATNDFTLPQTDASGQTYIGGGVISIRDNFSIVSKKFNFSEEGQNIQIGYIDLLLQATASGAMTLNVYLNYDNSLPVNQPNENLLPNETSDPFFNTIIPTTAPTTAPGNIIGSKYWQRIYCLSRGNFLTLQYTFSDAQLNGPEQQEQIQIDAQVIWARRAGRMTNI